MTFCKLLDLRIQILTVEWSGYNFILGDEKTWGKKSWLFFFFWGVLTKTILQEDGENSIPYFGGMEMLLSLS